MNRTGDGKGVGQRVKHEIKTVLGTTAYFAGWFCALLVLKNLILEEYDLGVGRISLALVGALVIAKTVLVLEHVPLGSWLDRQPGWVHVIVRTLVYTAGVFVVLLVEKAIEERHTYGGIGQALAHILEQANLYHVLATTLAVVGALLGFHAISVLRRQIGDTALLQAFRRPVATVPDESKTPAKSESG